MDRRRVLTLLAGSGVLAGCATSAPGLHLLPNGQRQATGFPYRRPDGSLPPKNAAGYRPAHEIVAVPVHRGLDVINRICTGDSCPGDGSGGDVGTQPGTVLRAGRVLGYYFPSQNYVETWTDDGSELLTQWYWSVDAGLSWYAAAVRRMSDVASSGGPTKPCVSCTTTSQSVRTSVSTAGGTFSALHDNGWSITGVADGAGGVTLTASVGADTVSSTIVYQPPRPSCAMVSFQAAAAIAPIALNALGSSSGCGTTPASCDAGGVLVGAMTAGTLAMVQQWEAAQAAIC
jgi:hypothetical protein